MCNLQWFDRFRSTEINWITSVRVVLSYTNLGILSLNVLMKHKRCSDECDPHWPSPRKRQRFPRREPIHWHPSDTLSSPMSRGENWNLTKRWRPARRSVYLIEIFSIFQWISVGWAWCSAGRMSCCRCRCRRSTRSPTRLRCWRASRRTPLSP